MASKKESTTSSPAIGRPTICRIALEIKGTAPLIQNAFAQKSIEEMLAKQMGISRQREKKKPSEIIENAIIRNVKGEVAMPCQSFKAAMISAASAIKTYQKNKKVLKTSLFIEGNSIKIRYEKMTSRMDIVRLPVVGRTPDVRFRPQFENWSARFIIQFPDTSLDAMSVADLVERGGSVGVGEWRPEKNGTFGTFTVTRPIYAKEEIEEIERENSVLLQTPQIPEWAMNQAIDLDMLAKLANSANVLAGSDESGDESEESGALVNGSIN